MYSTWQSGPESLPCSRPSRRGQDDDAVIISTTASIPGRASARDRIDGAKGVAVRQALAIELKLYTTRSLKRDETAGYVRVVRASGENDPDTVMCDAEPECDGPENDRSPMDSHTYARHGSGRRLFRLRQIARIIASRGKRPARIRRLEAP